MDALEDKAGSVMEAVKAMPAKGKAPHPRYSSYVPRLLEDKADFREARLVLWSQTLLPRELRFVAPNGNENIWDIPKIEPNPRQLNRTAFTAPKLPAGWKWEKAPVLQTPMPRNDVPPRVFRPNQ